MIDGFKNDLERFTALQHCYIARATGSADGSRAFTSLRQYFVTNTEYKNRLPSFVRTCASLDQFWHFIKEKFPSYAERRKFIWNELAPLMEHIEGGGQLPHDEPISNLLRELSPEAVSNDWRRALDRRGSDPEGAITAARTLLESVCKHILDVRGIAYDDSRIELHELYKLTANELTLSPNQHSAEVFKQILGGCSAIVSGLGTLRNRLGDAHGKSTKGVRPSPRHAELAVNLAGSVSMFLVATWRARDAD